MAGDSTLSLLLTGRDESASRAVEGLGRAADEARARLDALSTSIDVRVQLHDTDLDELRAELDRVASGATAQVRVELQGDDLSRLRAELDDLGRNVTARVRVEMDADLPELVDLRSALGWIDGRSVRARVSVTGLTTAFRNLVDLDFALTRLDALRSLTRLRIEIDIDSIDEVRELNELLDRVDRDITTRVRVDTDTDQLRRAADATDRLGGLFGTLRDRASSAVSGLVDIGTSAATLAAKAAVAGTAAVELVHWIAQLGPAAAVAAPAMLTFAEAMGVWKLAAAGVQQQFSVLTPQINALKAAAASEIHGGIQTLIAGLTADLPEIQTGVREMASALGDVAAQAGVLIQQPIFRGALVSIMKGNADATRALGDAGLHIVDAFVQVAAAAEPVWVALAHVVDTGAGLVDQWIGAKAASGDLATSIREAAGHVADLATGLWAFAVGAHSIFTSLAPGATDLSGSIRSVGLAFESWATAPSTVAAITSAVTTLHTEASAAAAALTAGFVSGEAPDSGWTGLFERLGATARELGDFVQQQLIPTLSALGGLVTGPVGQGLGSLADIIHGVVLDALSTLLTIVRDDVIPLFQDHLAPILNNDVIPAVSALATWVRDTLLPALQTLADDAAQKLGPALDSIATKIEQNKPELEALGAALLAVATAIVTVLVPALETYFGAAITITGGAIRALIEIISDLVVALASIASVALQIAVVVIGVFKSIFDAAASAVSGIIGVFALLPGPLGAPFRTAQGDVDAFKTKVDTDLSAAAGKARDTASSINGWLDGIRNKDVTVTITTIQKQIVTQELNSINAQVGKRASGGPVLAGTPYVVGEVGRELFVPTMPGYVFDAATTKAAMRSGRPASRGWDGAAAGGNVFNINVGAGVIATPGARRELAQAIAGEVRDAIANSAGSNGRRTGLPAGR